jgi:hypothetical protein
MPVSDRYTGQERMVVKTVFEQYASEYQKLGMKSEAEQLSSKAKSL